jgi:hypothetical protein
LYLGPLILGEADVLKADADEFRYSKVGVES